MRRLYKLAMLALCTLLYLGCVSTQAQKSPKKLIEFGWDIPRTAFIKQNIEQMEKRPFDGVVVRLNAGKKVFLHEPYEPKEFTQDLQNLKATNFVKFTDNFVLMWATTEEGWDWFNDRDWQASEQNIRQFAKVAQSEKFAGIFFDPEPYGVNPWLYPNLPKAKEKSFEEYWQQVRKRGAKFMQIIQQELPGVKVFFPFQLSYLSEFLDEPDPQKRMFELSQANYGLLAPFFNGILDASQPKTSFVDGNERSYYYTKSESFSDSYKLIKEELLTFIAPENRSKYSLQVEVGQALYIDQLFAMRPPIKSLLSYHLTSEERAKWLEHNTYYALSNSDKYVWCYSENMDWWQNKVPNGVEEAIRSAKQKIGADKPLGFKIEGMIQRAKLLQMAQKILGHNEK